MPFAGSARSFDTATLRGMNSQQRLRAAGRAPDDAEWEAIRSRRPEASGASLIIVTTTGIACLVGCSARTPRRDHVRIIDSLQTAIAAGARPCLRCRPDRAAGSEHAVQGTALIAAAGSGQPNAGAPGTRDGAALVAAALARLDGALAAGDAPPSDRELAAEAGVSERRLRAEMQERIGVTPRRWLAARRGERLRAHLTQGAPVLDALLDAGYGSASSAYEAAEGALGMAPGRYRRGAAGERIGWTVTPIEDGLALVAATARGLCAVRIGDDVRELEDGLRGEFPAADLVRDDDGLAQAAGVVADLAAGRPNPVTEALPVDAAGTAFRRRVWEALRRIPAGETRTYARVAAEIGAPRAVRAVASACATNPVALVVPCHRVIGTDGKMHGYRWGIERKRRILAAERAAARSASRPEPVAASA